MRRLILFCIGALTLVQVIAVSSTAAQVPLNQSELVPGKRLITCGPTESGEMNTNPRCTGLSGPDETTILAPVSTSPGASVQRTSSSSNVKKYVPYNRLATGPDGQPCATTGYVEEGTTPADERLLADPNPRESNIPTSGSDFRILETYPPCPRRPLAPGEIAPVETRAMVAARYWEEVAPLPKPQPFIAPGRAITGKLAYLETRNETSHTYRADTVFGPLTIIASGSYLINWGDGTTTGPHPTEGKPWPGGLITHDYLNVGTYNIVVTEKWTASWSLDGESGVLRTLQSTGRLNNFPVEQLQAVIGR